MADYRVDLGHGYISLIAHPRLRKPGFSRIPSCISSLKYGVLARFVTCSPQKRIALAPGSAITQRQAKSGFGRNFLQHTTNTIEL